MRGDLGGGLSLQPRGHRPTRSGPGGAALRGLFNSRSCWAATKQELPRTDRHKEFHLHSKQSWALALPRWQAETSPCPRPTRHAPALPAGSVPAAVWLAHLSSTSCSPGPVLRLLWCSLSFAAGPRFPLCSLSRPLRPSWSCSRCRTRPCGLCAERVPASPSAQQQPGRASLRLSVKQVQAALLRRERTSRQWQCVQQTRALGGHRGESPGDRSCPRSEPTQAGTLSSLTAVSQRCPGS